MCHSLQSSNYRFGELIISLQEECYFSFFLYYVTLKQQLTKENLKNKTVPASDRQLFSRLHVLEQLQVYRKIPPKQKVPAPLSGHPVSFNRLRCPLGL